MERYDDLTKALSNIGNIRTSYNSHRDSLEIEIGRGERELLESVFSLEIKRTKAGLVLQNYKVQTRWGETETEAIFRAIKDIAINASGNRTREMGANAARRAYQGVIATARYWHPDWEETATSGTGAYYGGLTLPPEDNVGGYLGHRSPDLPENIVMINRSQGSYVPRAIKTDIFNKLRGMQMHGDKIYAAAKRTAKHSKLETSNVGLIPGSRDTNLLFNMQQNAIRRNQFDETPVRPVGLTAIAPAFAPAPVGGSWVNQNFAQADFYRTQKKDVEFNVEDLANLQIDNVFMSQLTPGETTYIDKGTKLGTIAGRTIRTNENLNLKYNGPKGIEVLLPRTQATMDMLNELDKTGKLQRVTKGSEYGVLPNGIPFRIGGTGNKARLVLTNVSESTYGSMTGVILKSDGKKTYATLANTARMFPDLDRDVANVAGRENIKSTEYMIAGLGYAISDPVYGKKARAYLASKNKNWAKILENPYLDMEVAKGRGKNDDPRIKVFAAMAKSLFLDKAAGDAGLPYGRANSRIVDMPIESSMIGRFQENIFPQIAKLQHAAGISTRSSITTNSAPHGTHLFNSEGTFILLPGDMLPRIGEPGRNPRLPAASVASIARRYPHLAQYMWEKGGRKREHYMNVISALEGRDRNERSATMLDPAKALEEYSSQLKKQNLSVETATSKQKLDAITRTMHKLGVDKRNFIHLGGTGLLEPISTARYFSQTDMLGDEQNAFVDSYIRSFEGHLSGSTIQASSSYSSIQVRRQRMSEFAGVQAGAMSTNPKFGWEGGFALSAAIKPGFAVVGEDAIKMTWEKALGRSVSASELRGIEEKLYKEAFTAVLRNPDVDWAQGGHVAKIIPRRFAMEALGINPDQFGSSTMTFTSEGHFVTEQAADMDFDRAVAWVFANTKAMPVAVRRDLMAAWDDTQSGKRVKALMKGRYPREWNTFTKKHGREPSVNEILYFGGGDTQSEVAKKYNDIADWMNNATKDDLGFGSLFGIQEKTLAQVQQDFKEVSQHKQDVGHAWTFSSTAKYAIEKLGLDPEYGAEIQSMGAANYQQALDVKQMAARIFMDAVKTLVLPSAQYRSSDINSPIAVMKSAYGKLKALPSLGLESGNFYGILTEAALQEAGNIHLTPEAVAERYVPRDLSLADQQEQIKELASSIRRGRWATGQYFRGIGDERLIKSTIAGQMISIERGEKLAGKSNIPDWLRSHLSDTAKEHRALRMLQGKSKIDIDILKSLDPSTSYGMLGKIISNSLEGQLRVDLGMEFSDVKDLAKFGNNQEIMEMVINEMMKGRNSDLPEGMRLGAYYSARGKVSASRNDYLSPSQLGRGTSDIIGGMLVPWKTRQVMLSGDIQKQMLRGTIAGKILQSYLEEEFSTGNEVPSISLPEWQEKVKHGGVGTIDILAKADNPLLKLLGISGDRDAIIDVKSPSKSYWATLQKDFEQQKRIGMKRMAPVQYAPQQQEYSWGADYSKHIAFIPPEVFSAYPMLETLAQEIFLNVRPEDFDSQEDFERERDRMFERAFANNPEKRKEIAQYMLKSLQIAEISNNPYYNLAAHEYEDKIRGYIRYAKAKGLVPKDIDENDPAVKKYYTEFKARSDVKTDTQAMQLALARKATEEAAKIQAQLKTKGLSVGETADTPFKGESGTHLIEIVMPDSDSAKQVQEDIRKALYAIGTPLSNVSRNTSINNEEFVVFEMPKTEKTEYIIKNLKTKYLEKRYPGSELRMFSPVINPKMPEGKKPSSINMTEGVIVRALRKMSSNDVFDIKSKLSSGDPGDLGISIPDNEFPIGLTGHEQDILYSLGRMPKEQARRFARGIIAKGQGKGIRSYDPPNDYTDDDLVDLEDILGPGYAAGDTAGATRGTSRTGTGATAGRHWINSVFDDGTVSYQGNAEEMFSRVRRVYAQGADQGATKAQISKLLNQQRRMVKSMSPGATSAQISSGQRAALDSLFDIAAIVDDSSLGEVQEAIDTLRQFSSNMDNLGKHTEEMTKEMQFTADTLHNFRQNVDSGTDAFQATFDLLAPIADRLSRNAKDSGLTKEEYKTVLQAQDLGTKLKAGGISGGKEIEDLTKSIQIMQDTMVATGRAKDVKKSKGFGDEQQGAIEDIALGWTAFRIRMGLGLTTGAQKGWREEYLKGQQSMTGSLLAAGSDSTMIPGGQAAALATAGRRANMTQALGEGASAVTLPLMDAISKVGGSQGMGAFLQMLGQTAGAGYVGTLIGKEGLKAFPNLGELKGGGGLGLRAGHLGAASAIGALALGGISLANTQASGYLENGSPSAEIMRRSQVSASLDTQAMAQEYGASDWRTRLSGSVGEFLSPIMPYVKTFINSNPLLAPLMKYNNAALNLISPTTGDNSAQVNAIMAAEQAAWKPGNIQYDISKTKAYMLNKYPTIDAADMTSLAAGLAPLMGMESDDIYANGVGGQNDLQKAISNFSEYIKAGGDIEAIFSNATTQLGYQGAVPGSQEAIDLILAASSSSSSESMKRTGALGQLSGIASSRGREITGLEETIYNIVSEQYGAYRGASTIARGSGMLGLASSFGMTEDTPTAAAFEETVLGNGTVVGGINKWKGRTISEQKALISNIGGLASTVVSTGMGATPAASWMGGVFDAASQEDQISARNLMVTAANVSIETGKSIQQVYNPAYEGMSAINQEWNTRRDQGALPSVLPYGMVPGGQPAKTFASSLAGNLAPNQITTLIDKSGPMMQSYFGRDLTAQNQTQGMLMYELFGPKSAELYAQMGTGKGSPAQAMNLFQGSVGAERLTQFAGQLYQTNPAKAQAFAEFLGPSFASLPQYRQESIGGQMQNLFEKAYADKISPMAAEYQKSALEVNTPIGIARAIASNQLPAAGTGVKLVPGIQTVDEYGRPYGQSSRWFNATGAIRDLTAQGMTYNQATSEIGANYMNQGSSTYQYWESPLAAQQMQLQLQQGAARAASFQLSQVRTFGGTYDGQSYTGQAAFANQSLEIAQEELDIRTTMNNKSLEWRQQDIEMSKASVAVQYKMLDLAIQEFAVRKEMSIYERQYNKRMTAMQRGFQVEDWNIARERTTQQYDWQMEDLGTSKERLAVQGSWQEDDFRRALRTTSGRERIDLLRQMDRTRIQRSWQAADISKQEGRTETQYGWQVSDIDRAQARAQELWAMQDEHTAKMIEFENRLWAIQEARFSVQKEGIDIQMHGLDMQLLRLTEQKESQDALNKLSQNKLDLQKAQNAEDLVYAKQKAEIEGPLIAAENKLLQLQADNQAAYLLALGLEAQAAGTVSSDAYQIGIKEFRNALEDFKGFVNEPFKVKVEVVLSGTGASASAGAGSGTTVPPNAAGGIVYDKGYIVDSWGRLKGTIAEHGPEKIVPIGLITNKMANSQGSKDLTVNLVVDGDVIATKVVTIDRVEPVMNEISERRAWRQ